MTKLFGEKISTVRKHYKLTQEAFGKSLGIGKSAVSQAERDKIYLKESVVKHIISVYSVNPEWFYHDSGEMILKGCTDSPIISELIRMAREVLTSGTYYAVSLETNIKAFHMAIQGTREDCVGAPDPQHHASFAGKAT